MPVADKKVVHQLKGQPSQDLMTAMIFMHHLHQTVFDAMPEDQPNTSLGVPAKPKVSISLDDNKKGGLTMAVQIDFMTMEARQMAEQIFKLGLVKGYTFETPSPSNGPNRSHRLTVKPQVMV